MSIETIVFLSLICGLLYLFPTAMCATYYRDYYGMRGPDCICRGLFWPISIIKAIIYFSILFTWKLIIALFQVLFDWDYS